MVKVKRFDLSFKQCKILSFYCLDEATKANGKKESDYLSLFDSELIESGDELSHCFKQAYRYIYGEDVVSNGTTEYRTITSWKVLQSIDLKLNSIKRKPTGNKSNKEKLYLYLYTRLVMDSGIDEEVFLTFIRKLDSMFEAKANLLSVHSLRSLLVYTPRGELMMRSGYTQKDFPRAPAITRFSVVKFQDYPAVRASYMATASNKTMKNHTRLFSRFYLLDESDEDDDLMYGQMKSSMSYFMIEWVNTLRETMGFGTTRYVAGGEDGEISTTNFIEMPETLLDLNSIDKCESEIKSIKEMVNTLFIKQKSATELYFSPLVLYKSVKFEEFFKGSLSDEFKYNCTTEVANMKNESSGRGDNPKAILRETFLSVYNQLDKFSVDEFAQVSDGLGRIAEFRADVGKNSGDYYGICLLVKGISALQVIEKELAKCGMSILSLDKNSFDFGKFNSIRNLQQWVITGILSQSEPLSVDVFDDTITDVAINGEHVSNKEEFLVVVDLVPDINCVVAKTEWKHGSDSLVIDSQWGLPSVRERNSSDVSEELINLISFYIEECTNILLNSETPLHRDLEHDVLSFFYLSLREFLEVNDMVVCKLPEQGEQSNIIKRIKTDVFRRDLDTDALADLLLSGNVSRDSLMLLVYGVSVASNCLVAPENEDNQDVSVADLNDRVYNTLDLANSFVIPQYNYSDKVDDISLYNMNLNKLKMEYSGVFDGCLSEDLDANVVKSTVASTAKSVETLARMCAQRVLGEDCLDELQKIKGRELNAYDSILFMFRLGEIINMLHNSRIEFGKTIQHINSLKERLERCKHSFDKELLYVSNRSEFEGSKLLIMADDITEILSQLSNENVLISFVESERRSVWRADSPVSASPTSLFEVDWDSLVDNTEEEDNDIEAELNLIFSRMFSDNSKIETLFSMSTEIARKIELLYGKVVKECMLYGSTIIDDSIIENVHKFIDGVDSCYYNDTENLLTFDTYDMQEYLSKYDTDSHGLIMLNGKYVFKTIRDTEDGFEYYILYDNRCRSFKVHKGVGIQFTSAYNEVKLPTDLP